MYDENDDSGYIWGSIWKTRDDIKTFGLGIAVKCFLNRILPMSRWLALGLSHFSISNYTSLEFECKNTRHYFIINPQKKIFNLCDGVLPYIDKSRNDDELFSLEECSLGDFAKIKSDDEMFNAYNSFKTKNFYINRYFKHPWYDYKLYCIKRDGVKAILVTRECCAENSKCLRIVDYIGKHDWLVFVNDKIKKLLEENDYEYIDLIIAGEDSDLLKKAGFVDKDVDKKIVIPNYFEPFVKENVQMYYAYYNRSRPLVIYKADSDQDRPNYVMKKKLLT
jgi:hypothetical protein